MLKRIVNSRWFALTDLAFVLVSVFLWECQPQLGWRPLLLALIPWLIRVLSGSPRFQYSPFDFALVVFLLTAIVGNWAAYEPEGALTKFWLLMGAVLLYYAFARQPQENHTILVGLVSLFGVGVAIFFILTHDWQAIPTKIGFLDEIGLWWMEVRPTKPMLVFQPHFFGGVIAMTGPLMFVAGANIWKKNKAILRIAVALLFGLVLVSFALTTSRGAWLALTIVAGVRLLWWLVGRNREPPYRQRTFLMIITIAYLGFGVWFLLFGSAFFSSSGIPSHALGKEATRMGLRRNGLELVGDFPFTGIGLESFPGLFSHYIMGMPVFLLSFSYNLFVDSALEQGVLGFLMLAWVLFGSIWLLVRQLLLKPESPLHWGVLSGLLVVVLNGLVDNIVYYTLSAPLLLLLPGFAVTISNDDPQPLPKVLDHPNNWWLFGGIMVATNLVISVIFLFGRPMMAAWYANLGAVRMSKVDLAGFPTGVWDDGSSMSRFAPAEKMFLRALQYDPDNRTSHHRLGLIALLRRDFPGAVSHLERAYQADRDHRGIRKALGYSYAWSGKYDQAIPLLAELPEVRMVELDAHMWVWKTQGREDLFVRALKVKALLDSFNQGSATTP